MARKTVLLFLSFLIVCFGYPQDRDERKKPVLIRADQAEEEEIIEHSPEKARESKEIGDFYFKRDNYKAAADRYREAIRYDTEWPESYEKLVEALLEMNDLEGAIEACENFVTTNPGSKAVPEFKEKAQQFRAQASR